MPANASSTMQPSVQSQTAALALHSLSRSFGELHAVRDLTLEVPRGSVYGFLGPNGAGKTTTIRLLLGLLRPDRGDVLIFGESLAKRRVALLRRLGAMVETPSLYPHLTGRENLEIRRLLLNSPRSSIDRVLGTVDLVKSANRLVADYSLGMRQRLGLAQALLGEPELLVLDEPTNGLDPAGIQDMRELLRGMPRQHGVTVFLSSHLLSEVEQMASHVGIISKGSLLFDGTIGQLHARQSLVLTVGIDRPSEAAAILRTRGFDANVGNHSLTLQLGEPEAAAAINSILVTHGFAVHQLSIARPTLEATFLEMTAE